ncbi:MULTISPECIES: 3-hydroxyacyl-CoA dehydrogenase [unclassified Mesorhizobium]|uniref:3-hydroxyacyl-CoA dehydrogenase n=1 Tax=unclassified Mesorhizobium TaxID=325217 RepID=UPI000FE2B48F|nr:MULTISPECIES: 3-hydroxyacyl-CoA dehydrogenase [unclassified Mesorhizobium]MDG4895597.1 3-hydroxyacyl-CoA dehydrogenase [Mesorhizobium sp. WSM4976]RWH70541.1 MAG: 3-hydroxyacyl-CoA dehydrogenase [Mesorhizobium sp.]RWL24097.1 MAG: 3-hydroxyacyl-CoA dehydrogenase [Mesorhizobium sp.]RWL30183.1 MAG: 3-hydroxyacyl-CoA dehydrogenase [Mesorhizobium sp.]RWL37035.1 MAG: 3-hydroxyacyl-CoA dehydrogenase [Mesorhizobium sp.]
MTTVAIVGSGFIGRGWAISFARSGHAVRMWDHLPEAAEGARNYIAGVLGDLAANDLLRGQVPDEVLARITIVNELAEAVRDAVHIQENTPEKREIKREIFTRIDAVADPGAVIASSTSALLPSTFTDHLAGRHRCLVVHPINPPYLVPAAEVVPAPWTSRETVDKTRAFLVSAGHAPLVMTKELDGFIMNRMQGALLEEAFRLVAGGYASVEDVDVGIRDGLALRWSFMGPFETIDLNAPGGVRDYVERYQSIYSNIFPQMRHRVDWAGQVLQTVESERRRRLPQEGLLDRQVWRDRRLMALAAHKKKADEEFGQ